MGETPREEAMMDRLAIVARLKDGKHTEVEAILAEGPPFEPEALGFHRHGVYLTATEIVFLFEAPEVEWIVNDVIDDPVLSTALDPWRNVIDGPPRLAHERYFWSREREKTGIGLGT
jgi:hypothetical protein